MWDSNPYPLVGRQVLTHYTTGEVLPPFFLMTARSSSIWSPIDSGLENSMDCIVHGAAKSQTRLSDFHFHY